MDIKNLGSAVLGAMQGMITFECENGWRTGTYDTIKNLLQLYYPKSRHCFCDPAFLYPVKKSKVVCQNYSLLFVCTAGVHTKSVFVFSLFDFSLQHLKTLITHVNVQHSSTS